MWKKAKSIKFGFIAKPNDDTDHDSNSQRNHRHLATYLSVPSRDADCNTTDTKVKDHVNNVYIVTAMKVGPTKMTAEGEVCLISESPFKILKVGYLI